MIFFFTAITIGVRILGPAGGFILGSFCTRLYVNPSEDPGFSTNDPQWVGAWWLGKFIFFLKIKKKTTLDPADFTAGR